MPEQLKENRRQIPWWVHILLATVLYIGLTYLVPSLHSDNKNMETFLGLLPHLAPILAICFLLLGAKALYSDVPGKTADPKDDEKISLDKD
jgi:restriction system protein